MKHPVYIYIYNVNSSDLKPVKYTMHALIPSHIYCNQLKVFSGLVFKFIMLCVMAKVRGKLFIDTTSGVLYNFWSTSPHYGLFYNHSAIIYV
jgi:hypothetical protein